jgi:hypothetical protein
MSTTPQTDVWALLPASMKRAGLVALTTLFLAGAMLYQENIRSDQPPDFSRGGWFAGDPANPAPDEIVVATPTPIPKRESRSSATLTAPRGSTDEDAQGPPFPAIGRYAFTVDGTESASLFGSRAYPPEMTMTVHRRAPGDSTDPPLDPDELAFDLDFSAEHQERETVAYRPEGIMFTFEARSVTIGPGTQASETTYEPPITQVPIPLVVDATAEGTSRAVSTVDGSEVRTDHWTVKVTGRQQIEIMGADIDAFVLQVDQQSQPGSSQQFTRSRKYWLDPVRAIWVKWEEHVSARQDVGIGSFTYTTNFTATLDRIEPL